MQTDLPKIAESLQPALEEYERRFRLLDTQIRILERERQKFSAVVNHTDTGFIVLDSSLSVIWANEAVSKRFSLEAKLGIPLGRICNQILCGKDSLCQHCPALSALRTGLVTHQELQRDIQGESRQIYATAMPIRSPEGVIAEAIIMLQDLTDLEVLRRSQEALRASEERFRSIFENAAAGMATVSPPGNFLQVNSALCQMLGYSPAELLQLSVADVTYPDDLQLTQKLIQEAQAGICPGIDVEKRYLRKDGQVVWGHTSAAWLFDSRQRPLYAVALIQNVTERKTAEEALRQSQERLRTVVSNSPIILFALDREGKFTLSEGKGLEALGLKPEDVIGKTVYELYKDVPQIIEDIQRASSGDSFTSLVELPGLVYESWYAPIRDSVGQIKGVIGVASDITKRKKAEDELKQTLSLLSSTLESTADGILVVDRQGKIVTFNQKFVQMWRIPEGVISSRDDRQALEFVLSQLEEPQTFLAKVKELYSRPEAESYNLLEFKDGRVFERYSQPHKIGGECVGRVWSFRDITQRRRAEEALVESESRYRQFFEEDLTGDFISTPEGKILDCNPAFARIFGYESVEEILKAGALPLYPNAQVREEFIELLKEKRKLEYHQIELRRQDGKPVYVIENVIGVFDQQGNLIQLKGYLFDDTERKLAEQALRQSEERLRQSQKLEAVGRLAGGIAHDFNNFLTIIMGRCQLLSRRLAEPDPLARDLDLIQKTSERAASLTRQLLAFSRKQVLQPKVLDLNEILSNLEPMLRSLVGEDIELALQTDPEVWRVKADPSQIEQVILNLVVNAKEAMPQSGKLGIETKNLKLRKEYAGSQFTLPAGSYLLLQVTDSGIGMDQETLAFIFEPFFTTKEKGKGTGLGLATVYGIVKQSGGYIEAESKPGQGSIFKIYLPQVCEPVSEDMPQAEDGRPLAGSETVLLVEDEPAVRELIRDFLQQSGYKVLEPNSGPEALKIFQTYGREIPLLITDVVMPQMSGPSLANRLKELKPDLKVLYISGYTDEAVLKQGISTSQVAFLQKPFSQETLARKVREVLESESVKS